jgi:diguanylate cyclase (GGDEF)-like protein/PAS domain S-box-containing protein
MKPEKTHPPGDASEEVSALIATLHETGQRLEELTAGEVDAVADRHGRTFVLRRAQEQLRHIEEAKQAAILNALPAHIALLDSHGLILSVNEAWRRFGGTNVIQRPGYAIGLNYLEICDSGRADHPSDAHKVADGIRSVLSGGPRSFSLEYPSHSPTEQRCFLLTVTPLLANGRPNGAVVMHVDVTAERQTEESLRASELRFRQVAENIREVFWLTDPAKNQILYVSPAYAEIWGRSLESLYASPRDWIDAIHPEDRSRVLHAAQTKQASGEYAEEYRIVRPDGVIRWIRDRAFPVFRNEREVYRIAGLAEDITDRKQAEEELHRSESLKGAILESSLDCLIAIDHEGRIVEFNPAAEAAFGVTREQALGKAMVDLIVPPRLRDAHRRGFARYLATGKGTILGKRLELEAIRADGTEFPIELTITAIGGTSTPMFTGFIRDITARKEATGKIEKLSRIRAVSSEINAAIFRIRERKALLEETCRIASEKGKFEMIWIGAIDQDAQQVQAIAWKGFSEKTVRAVSWANISTTKGTLDEAIRTRKPSVRNDIEGQLPGGGLRPEALDRGCRSTVCLPLVVDDKVVALIVLFAPGVGFFDEEELVLLNEVAADVSFALQAIEKQKKLDYLSYYDVLTGLANRSLFLERVAQYMRGAISGGHKLAVGLVDLERFKNINDSLGRPAGDALLKQVAEWLTRRTGDASVLARVGADHFAAVLPEVKRDGNLAGLIDGLMAAFLAHPFRLNDAVFRVALKMGVALFPDDGADADTLFKNAEAALKKAKASGDPYLFYTQKMTDTVAGKLTLENQLRQALDNEEFVLHYQPKVNLASGEVTGAEALIRWNDPRTGLVPPGRFIPILEETGLIFEVGRWALRQAVADRVRWRTAGLAAVRIAVNVSPLQLRHREFIAEIEQAIGIDAHAAAGLELEITESLIMEGVKHNIATLRAIRAMGVTIAIDDFGTGFSSLSYLSKLPVDTLKIDRSFVIDMTANADGRALVSTIINLAHSLKLNVVAEGVETEEQSRLLRLLGCDEMQGFLFGKPVPREIFETKFLARLPQRDEREAVEIHHLG